MATAVISAHKATGGGRPDTPSLAFAGSVRASQVITTTASNAVSTVIGKAGETVTVCVDGGAIRIAHAVGENPNAASGAQFLCGDGASWSFFCERSDSRFAVANV